MTTRILVCGMAVMDFIFEVDELPTQPLKYVAQRAQATGGGCAANAAVTIARLGARPVLAARVGDDLVGGLICQELLAEGVDLSLLTRCAQGGSSFSSVMIDASGDRQIVNFRGRGLSATAEFAAQPVGALHAVLADTRWTEGAIAAMMVARDNGIPGILDAEDTQPADALQHATHIAFSRQGLASLAGDRSPEPALRLAAEHYDAWLCVTDGGAGVWYLEDDAVVHVPAFEVSAVDTLGAGDVWHGAFAWALAHRQSEHQAVIVASATAALKCTRPGGGRSTPTRTDVEAFVGQSLLVSSGPSTA